MKKIILTSILSVIVIALFAQAPLNNINTKFDDGTWGEIISRGSANLPPSGSYPSSKINGFTLTNAAMYGSNTTCSKGRKHSVCIILDKQKEGAYLEFPPVKELEELEIHASTGTPGMKFALEEKVKNSWREIGIYTTQRNDSIYIIKLPRKKETTLRIRNATNSGLYVYQVTTKTSDDVNRVNISKYTPGEGSKISANLVKNITIEFDKNVKTGNIKPTLNGTFLNPEVNDNMVNIPVSLDFGVEYSLVLPVGAFTDTKGANPNLETTISFSTYKAVSTPKGFTTHLDVVYKTVDNWDGRMDLYLPPNNGNPTPIIINMHGGGWNHGVKEQISGFGSIMKHNIAVANVEYRLTPQALAPAAVEDVRCAMLYIINNAKELNVDVNKIVFMGTSAGAHLALTAAYLQDDNTYDAGCNKGIPFKIAAVLDRYGPTDLANFFSYKSVVNWLGGQNVDLAKKMSPLYYVNAKTPPTFIVHGNADAVVPYSQSKVLHDALIKTGVKTEFITIEGGGHGNFPKEKKDEVEEELVKFLLNALSK